MRGLTLCTICILLSFALGFLRKETPQVPDDNSSKKHWKKYIHKEIHALEGSCRRLTDQIRVTSKSIPKGMSKEPILTKLITLLNQLQGRVNTCLNKTSALLALVPRSPVRQQRKADWEDHLYLLNGNFQGLSISIQGLVQQATGKSTKAMNFVTQQPVGPQQSLMMQQSFDTQESSMMQPMTQQSSMTQQPTMPISAQQMSQMLQLLPQGLQQSQQTQAPIQQYSQNQQVPSKVPESVNLNSMNGPLKPNLQESSFAAFAA